jgi:hypothetical protein
MKIEKKEIIYALIGVASILMWFLWLRKIIAPTLETLPPFIAMVLYNFGLFIGLFLISGVLNGRNVRWRSALITFVIILGVDILYAPYLVTTSGELLNDFDYWYVSTDIGFGSLYSYFLPLAWVWTFTYIITPVLLMVFFPIIILKPKQIAKMFGH